MVLGVRWLLRLVRCVMFVVRCALFRCVQFGCCCLLHVDCGLCCVVCCLLFVGMLLVVWRLSFGVASWFLIVVECLLCVILLLFVDRCLVLTA